MCQLPFVIDVIGVLGFAVNLTPLLGASLMFFCFYLKDTWMSFFDHRIASCPQLLTLIYIRQSKVVPEVSNGRSTAGLKYQARGAANTSEYNGVENSGVCGNHLVCLANG